MLFPGGISTNVLTVLINFFALAMALFVAMPFHEFAHAAVAKHEGDYTAVVMKRYTLAPLAHFDWKGFLFLFLFRFGWAKPVPVDERNFKRGRKSKFLVSIAGILMNILLGIVFLFIYMLILKFYPSFYSSSVYGYLVYSFLYMSVSINFSFAIFNILPIYPLDGFHIVESFSKTGNNAYLNFMRRYSLIIYFILIFTNIYYIYYSYTAGLLINWLVSLFSTLLGI